MSEEQTNDAARGASGCAAPSAMVRTGDKIGRFSILAEVGAGGMGRIYEAYDANLDRRVALKLLRDVGDDERRERLAREAKALARLDHPNVVTVHDVGVHEGLLFVAMEFVRGGTLEQWLATHPVGGRGRLEAAIRLLVDAGRGLVAAHAAGLVHRDVKPSNILIGADGRARVADFGIARAVGQEALSPDLAGDDGDEPLMLSTDDAASAQTGTGTSIGTPAYVAPEQLGRAPVDAAADQFSFCVTAWEVLFGVRPFAAADPRARLAQVRKGDLRRPDKLEVQPEIEALLRQGLCYQPSQRHRRLEDLVDALSLSLSQGKGPGMGRRSAWRWGLAAVGFGLVAAGGAYRMGQTEQKCAAEAGVAFEEVWDDDRRDAVRGAVLGSGVEFAPGAWARLERGIDAYAETWREGHAEACEATRVRAEQSPERMDERLACLGYARQSVDALLDLVSSGDASAVASEWELLEGLPAIDACADARGVPTSSEVSVLGVVARASTLRSAGRSNEGLRLIEPVVQELAEETSPMVRARVLLEYGRALSEASNPRWALDPLSEAYAIAQAEGSTQVAGAAARGSTKVHTSLSSDPEMLQGWLASAKAEGATSSLSEQVELLMLEGVLLRRKGDRVGATKLFERSVEVAKRDAGLLPRVRRRLSEELVNSWENENAVEVARQALAEFRDQFGPEHPGLGIFESTVATALQGAASGPHDEEIDEAEELARRALERAENIWGEGHLATSRYLVRLTSVYCSLNRDTETGLAAAKAALRLHRDDEMTLSRDRALRALIRCALRREDQFAKEAWDLVFLTKQIYGEKHQKTVLAQARYAQALLRAPHPAVDGLSKQLLLASALAKERLPGWDARTAILVHGILGDVAISAVRGPMALEHAQAALELVVQDKNTAVGLEADVRRLVCAAKWEVEDREGALAECLVALEVLSREPKPEMLALAEFTVGRIFVRLGRHQEALPHMENAVQLVEQAGIPGLFVNSTLMLGEINEALGRCAEAEKSFRAASEFTEGSDGIQGFLAAAHAARMAACLGRYEDAWAQLGELKARGRGSDPFHQALIWEATGFIKHRENPRTGAAEYARALEFHISIGWTPDIEGLCRRSPFQLSECKRLGYASGPE